MAGRGLTIASDSLQDNADTIQGHHPQGSNFSWSHLLPQLQLPFQCHTATLVPYRLGQCQPKQRPQSPHKQPIKTKNRWAPAQVGA